MWVELISICSCHSVKELMEQLDTLMSDSDVHNKQVNMIVQDLFNLDKALGQLFCGTHTCLGFSKILNKMVMDMTRKMKFMVGMDVDSKSGSSAGQAQDIMLRLVTQEYTHKSWNYHGLYTRYLVCLQGCQVWSAGEGICSAPAQLPPP